MQVENNDLNGFFAELSQNINGQLRSAMTCFETELKRLDILPGDKIRKGMSILQNNVEASLERSIDSIELFAKDNVFQNMEDIVPRNENQMQTENAQEFSNIQGEITKEITKYYDRRQNFLEKQVVTNLTVKQKEFFKTVQNENDFGIFKNKMDTLGVSRNKMKEMLHLAKKKQEDFATLYNNNN